MQERFNKDLEEMKKSQYIMNNAINEIKNTLEGTNSRIMEAEDRMHEVEDRMVEINEAERILYMFQCHSPKSSHLVPLPQSPKDCSLHQCLFCYLIYRVIVNIFLNSIYMR